MSPNVREYRIPTTLEHALRILAERGARAAVVGGGSVQALRLPSRVQSLIDLARCGLESIQIDGKGVRLGATVSAAAVAACEPLDQFGGGLLREAAAAITPQAVRNQVTVAGNLAGYMSWSDLPVALLALGAKLKTARAGGEKRTIELGVLYTGHPRKVLQPGEVITAVAIAAPTARSGGAFIKMARTVSDTALASAAAYLELEDGRCSVARLALGAVQPRPLCLTAVEQLLVGEKPSPELFAKAAEKAVAELVVTADYRASKEYRHELAQVAARRALAEAYRRACGEARLELPRQVAPPPWTRKAPGHEVGHVLTVEVDGRSCRFPIQPDDVLLDVLRREGVSSVKRGCDEGYCGTCAVLVDGRLLNACLLPAAHVEGCSLTTAAGLGTAREPHLLQRLFVEEGAVQCGFCTPGFILAGKVLLDAIPEPSEAEIRNALDGNLCRCTGYTKPIIAVHKAAAARKQA